MFPGRRLEIDPGGVAVSGDPDGRHKAAAGRLFEVLGDVLDRRSLVAVDGGLDGRPAGPPVAVFPDIQLQRLHRQSPPVRTQTAQTVQKNPNMQAAKIKPPRRVPRM